MRLKTAAILVLLSGAAWSWAPVAAQDQLPSLPDAAPAEPGRAGGRSAARLPQPITDSPWSWGPLRLRPHLTYAFDYGDGIQARPGRMVKTELHRLSPGFLFDLGDRWSAAYAATWNFFSSDAFRDTTAHSARAEGRLELGEWLVLISQRAAISEPPLIETATQTRQEIHATDVTVLRQFTSALSGQLAINQDLRFIRAFSNTYQRSLTPSLAYQLRPDLEANVSVTVGHVEVTEAPDMWYYRPQVGLAWHPGDKLGLTVFGGSERRDFLSGPAPDLVSPIYGATLAYDPISQTQLRFELVKTVSPSFFAGQATESESYSFEWAQRLLGFLNLAVGYSVDETRFVAAGAGLPIVRNDDRSGFFVRLGTPFLSHGTLTLSYRESANDSNQPEFSFDSSVVGLEIRYRY